MPSESLMMSSSPLTYNLGVRRHRGRRHPNIFRKIGIVRGDVSVDPVFGYILENCGYVVTRIKARSCYPTTFGMGDEMSLISSNIDAAVKHNEA